MNPEVPKRDDEATPEDQADGRLVIDSLKRLFPTAEIEPGDEPNETVFHFEDPTTDTQPTH